MRYYKEELPDYKYLPIFNDKDALKYPYNLLMDVAAKRKLVIRTVNNHVSIHHSLDKYILTTYPKRVYSDVEFLMIDSDTKHTTIMRDLYILELSAKEIARRNNTSVNRILSARASCINKMSKNFYKYIKINKKKGS